MYKFVDNEYQEHLEARFWNNQGNHIAIVACITKRVDWAAYIGTDAPNSHDKYGTLKYVAEWGCKLTETDARYFFPDISLPYRD